MSTIPDPPGEAPLTTGRYRHVHLVLDRDFDEREAAEMLTLLRSIRGVESAEPGEPVRSPDLRERRVGQLSLARILSLLATRLVRERDDRVERELLRVLEGP